MKITFERWVAIAFLGCLALGSAILPADGSRWIPSWWVADAPNALHAWYAKMNARGMHAADAFATYEAARDLVSARREFGSTQGKAGNPDVRFAANVPPAMREAFMKALSGERAERPDWRGRGKVGVLVAVDSVVTTHGVVVHRGPIQSGGRTVSRMIAPSALTGDRCVVEIKLPTGNAWSTAAGVAASSAAEPLLDACGFYDAFGAPGAVIARELVDSRYLPARGYVMADQDDPEGRDAPTRSWSAVWYDLPAARCLAGQDDSCWHLGSGWWGWRRAERYPVEWPGGSDQWLLSNGRFHIGALNRIALELGPDRFARVWKSSKTFEDAYFDETGEPWANYVREGDRARYGPYESGPWTTPISLALTLLTVLGLVAATLRFGGRPGVA